MGHDILTSYEAGKANQSTPDEEVLAFASQQNRILLTLNRKHFLRLHKINPDHTGIIACTFDLNFDSQAERISEICKQNEPLNGKFLRLNRPG